MKKPLTLIVLCLLFLFACKADEPRNQIVGNDRDAHGCIPSAGYSWCNKTKQCERPWELAKQEGFENTLETFNAFCGNSPK